MCSPVLGRGEARGAAAAIAGQRLNGGAHFIVAEGQEAAGGARVQHARAVEEGEAALGQGSLEGTGLALSAGSRQSGISLPPPPENPQGVYVLILRADLSQGLPSPGLAFPARHTPPRPDHDPDWPSPSFPGSLGPTYPYPFPGDRRPQNDKPGNTIGYANHPPCSLDRL